MAVRESEKIVRDLATQQYPCIRPTRFRCALYDVLCIENCHIRASSGAAGI